MDYELTFILQSSLSDKERETIVDKVKKWVEDGKGVVKKSDIWGKRLLSYRIKKALEGIYIFMLLNLEPKEVAQLSKKLKLEENVVRYLIVKD